MNTTPLATLFDRAAQAYDAERHMLVPCFEGFYSAGVEAVGPLGPGARLMDLGAGTGLFSALVAAANPGISVTLVDIAAGMLAEAEKRFAAAALPAPEIVVADYAETLPAGPFDAIVSAVSIHHLETERKARLLRFVAERLAPGGVFVNAEQILGDTPEAEAALDAEWEAAARSLGASDAVIEAARARMVHDRSETMDGNLALLSAAGLTEPKVTFRDGRFAVFVAASPIA
ncbi:MAG: class I SAM-dependent methyltransferase [Pseudomonadota bacterium]